MPGRAGVAALRGRGPDPEIGSSRAQSVNHAPTSATATCPYCGAAIRPGEEEMCPSEFIRRAAEELLKEMP